MNEGHLHVPGEVLIEDDYAYFMAAWRYKLAQCEMSQRDLAAKTGSSYQWLNAVYKERVVRGKRAKASSDLQKVVAEVFGYGWIEFLQLGKRITLEHLPIEEAVHEEVAAPKPPDAKPTRIDPLDVVDAVSALARKLHQCEDDIRLWRLVFDLLPVAALIIKDGLIHFQNQRARAWGHDTGKPLTESCLSVDCQKSGDCPVLRSIESVMATSGSQRIGGVSYIIKVIPVPINDHSCFVVMALEDEHQGWNRRQSDRKAEDQREIQP